MRIHLWLSVLSLCALSACLCKSREEKLQAAEDEGNLLAATKAKMVKGVGEAMKKEGKEAAETVTEGVGEMVKGVGAGVEKGLKEVSLSVQGDLSAKGLTANRATRGEEGAKQHSVSVYVATEKPWTGTLELRAYDDQDREAGRVQVKWEEKEPTAKYVDFEFDPRAPILTAKRFELREVAAAPAP